MFEDGTAEDHGRVSWKACVGSPELVTQVDPVRELPVGDGRLVDIEADTVTAQIPSDPENRSDAGPDLKNVGRVYFLEKLLRPAFISRGHRDMPLRIVWDLMSGSKGAAEGKALEADEEIDALEGALVGHVRAIAHRASFRESYDELGGSAIHVASLDRKAAPLHVLVPRLSWVVGGGDLVP